ncbi:hypothetical protein [Streptomyces ardesiacus]|uniref:hypothetical protein n=1 Tax=Streptomyces ardesiacus TaxID=285564 RepID=UPI0036523C40
MFTEINYYEQSSRDIIGGQHFMKQLEREYDFPVNVFQVNKDGSRALVRVENPYS